MYFSDKNLAAIEIELSRFWNIGWLLLIVNLDTRKRYWIAYESIEEKIYAKVTDVDLEDLRLPGEFSILQMKLEPNRIEIQLEYLMEYLTIDDMPEVFLGQS